MSHEIQLWLQSTQDYPSGIVLFDRFCRNPNLGRILRVGGATGKNRKTLAYELQKIARVSHTEPLRIASDSTPVVSDQIPKNPVSKLPSAIDELRSKQKLTYKLLDNLHAVLPFRPIEERKTIAFQILELDDQLSEINGQIAYYEKYGVIPVSDIPESEKPVSALSEVELIRRQNLVRTYVSKYKRLSTESESLRDRDKYARLLEKYSRELEEITKRLNR